MISYLISVLKGASKEEEKKTTGPDLRFVVEMSAGAGGLALDDCHLHVLDFDPNLVLGMRNRHRQVNQTNQDKVNFANHDIAQVVLALVVLELNVQALFYANLHLDRIVRFGFHLEIGVRGNRTN